MTNQQPTNPFADVAKMMEQFKMPGIDMTTIVEARRKDIEALVEANKAAFETMQALAKKQTAMMTEAMQGMQTAAQAMLSGGMPDPAKQAEALRKGFEKTLADMKELADMARHAQNEAMVQVVQRASQQAKKS
ncbi:phasin family protein [Roseateles sp.]|uniref:phasin family protein n=1 Tax=Roseateles sp. TaxID=1971397 RepID=UPI0032659F9C